MQASEEGNEEQELVDFTTPSEADTNDNEQLPIIDIPKTPSNTPGLKAVELSISEEVTPLVLEDEHSPLTLKNYAMNETSHIYESVPDETLHLYESVSDEKLPLYECYIDSSHIYESMDDEEPHYETIAEKELPSQESYKVEQTPYLLENVVAETPTTHEKVSEEKTTSYESYDTEETPQPFKTPTEKKTISFENYGTEEMPQPFKTPTEKKTISFKNYDTEEMPQPFKTPTEKKTNSYERISVEAPAYDSFEVNDTLQLYEIKSPLYESLGEENSPSFKSYVADEESISPAPAKPARKTLSKSKEVFRKNGRYNLLQDLFQIMELPDDTTLQTLNNHDPVSSCDFCLAYANNAGTLYQYHTHAIGNRSSQRKCFCGEVRTNGDRLKEHILSNHVMIDIFCEYDHDSSSRPVYQTLRAYQIHVKKKHSSEYSDLKNNPGAGYICAFCQDEQFIKGTQIEYLTHLTHVHSRRLMELKLLRWPAKLGTRPIKAMKETYKEILHPDVIFMQNVIPSPAGILPLTPKSSPSHMSLQLVSSKSSFGSMEISGMDSQANFFDTFKNYDLIRALLYLDINREDHAMWNTFMELYRIRHYCDFCRAIATGSDAKQIMEDHEKQHRDFEFGIQSPYLCFCGSNHRDAAALKDHIMGHHTKIILRCEYCGKTHLSVNALGRHVREKHADVYSTKRKEQSTAKSVWCPFCVTYRGHSAFNLLSHCIRIHFRLLIELSFINATIDVGSEQVLSFASTHKDVTVFV